MRDEHTNMRMDTNNTNNANKMVSIILPTYNGAGRIRVSIESILGQSYADWELLVIDDGSSDSTEELVKNLAEKDKRIIYIKNENNLGIQKTLNKGLKQARGEYIARIDDDDEWIDIDKLKNQIEFLEHNQDHVLVGTGVIVVDEDNKELFRYFVPKSDLEIRKKILSKNCFVHSSVMFRKDSVMKLGGYNESPEVRHVEDYDLWLKLGTLGKVANLLVYGVKFTLRSGSISSKNKVEQFRKDISLIKNYKNIYPRYYLALMRSIVRLAVYGFVVKVPIKLPLYKLIKIYKKR